VVVVKAAIKVAAVEVAVAAVEVAVAAVEVAVAAVEVAVAAHLKATMINSRNASRMPLQVEGLQPNHK
jgi:hypothetical protein